MNYSNKKKLLIITVCVQFFCILAQFFNFLEFIFKPLHYFNLTTNLIFIYNQPINGLIALTFFWYLLIIILIPNYILFFSNYFALLFLNEYLLWLKKLGNFYIIFYFYSFIYLFIYYPINLYLLIYWLTNNENVYKIQTIFDISYIIKSICFSYLFLFIFLFLIYWLINYQINNIFYHHYFYFFKLFYLILNLLILILLLSFSSIINLVLFWIYLYIIEFFITQNLLKIKILNLMEKEGFEPTTSKQ